MKSNISLINIEQFHFQYLEIEDSIWKICIQVLKPTSISHNVFFIDDIDNIYMEYLQDNLGSEKLYLLKKKYESEDNVKEALHNFNSYQ